MKEICKLLWDAILDISLLVMAGYLFFAGIHQPKPECLLYFGLSCLICSVSPRGRLNAEG